MVSIAVTEPKSNLLLVRKSTFTKIEVHNNPNKATRQNTIEQLQKHIPNSLQNLIQYVLWKYQIVKDNPEKPKKPPFSPINGKLISPTATQNVGSFEEALVRYNWGGYAGIGIILRDRVITALDLDHCINEDGTIKQWAQKIIDRLKPYAYIEISPSGEGIRILINAKLPFDGRRQGPFEAYSHGRYVTLTGNYLEG